MKKHVRLGVLTSLLLVCILAWGITNEWDSAIFSGDVDIQGTLTAAITDLVSANVGEMTVYEGEGTITIEDTDRNISNPVFIIETGSDNVEIYALPEGEDGWGFSIGGSPAGKIKVTGWNGDVVGNVTGDLTGDSTGTHYGNVEGNVEGDLTGDSTGTHYGDVEGGDITGDSFETNEGEGYLKLRRGASDDLVICADEEGEPEGMYPLSEGENGWGFVVDGAEVVTVKSDGFNGNLIGNVDGNLDGDSDGTHTGKVKYDDGTEGEPSDSYTNDPDTGRIRIGANEMGWVTGGTLRLRLSTSALTSTLPIVLPLGSAANPSIYGTGDSDTGIYFGGSNLFYVTTNGSQRLAVTTAAVSANNASISCVNYFPGTGVPQFQIMSSAGLSGFGVSGSYASPSGFELIHKGSVAATYDTGSYTTLYSGGEYYALHTNYYTGANHNKTLYRATRGTSASPDYLDDDDVLGRLKFEARDGAGTWGDGAEIRVVANGDHASADTPSSIDFYSTPDSTDTQKLAARIYTAVLLPGVLDKPMATIDTRQITFDMAGGSLGFGYYGDLDANWTGVCIFDAETAHLALMLGTDGYTYLQNGSGANPFSDDSWRYGDDGNEGFAVEQYDKGGTTWEKHFRVSENGAEVNSDEAFYLGDPSTDGSWRIIRDGNNLVHQRRESSTWTTKNTITP